MSTHAAVGSGRDLRALYGSDIEDEAALPGERVLARDSRICEVCRKPFHPTRSWQRHHNDRCRKEGWLARQHALDFEPVIEPRVVDLARPPAEQPKLVRMSRRILGRLEQGSALASELQALFPTARSVRTRISNVSAFLRSHEWGEVKSEPVRGVAGEWRYHLHLTPAGYYLFQMLGTLVPADEGDVLLHKGGQA